MFTKEQIKKYIKSGYSDCPYCGKSDIEGSMVEIDGRYAIQGMSCLNCHKNWNDVYALANIEEVGE